MIHRYVQDNILAADHVCISAYSLNAFSFNVSTNPNANGGLGSHTSHNVQSTMNIGGSQSSDSTSTNRFGGSDNSGRSRSQSNTSTSSGGMGSTSVNGTNSTAQGPLERNTSSNSILSSNNTHVKGTTSSSSSNHGRLINSNSVSPTHMILFSTLDQSKFAILLLSAQLNPIEIIPILSPCSLKITSETEFTLFLRKGPPKMFKFSMASAELWNCVSTLGSAISHLIQENKDDSDTIDYEWLKPYEYLFGDISSGKDSKNHISESKPTDFSETIRGSSQPLSPRRNPSMHDLKDQWIQSQLMNRRAEFTEQINMTILIGTFNVNMKIAREEDKFAVQQWLQIKTSSKVQQVTYPDLIFIGLQEIDMSATAVLREQTDAKVVWDHILRSALNTTNDGEVPPKNKPHYDLVCSRQMVGIYSALFVNKKYHKTDLLKEVFTSAEGVGVMGLGNKGAVGIRLELHKSTFCFINSHLSPHQGNIERRNHNYHDILKRLSFNDRRYTPQGHDYLFWVGDLNYRINMEYNDAIQCVKESNYKRLLEHDQLGIERRRNAFQLFDEAEINFPCTYRYNVGTDILDTSEKKRIPAYTDRILWKYNDSIKNLVYTSFPDLRISDHKPVSASFIVPVQVIIKDKYKKIQNEVIKTLDKMENDMLPEIKLNHTEFHFGQVRFEEVQTQTLIVQNIGKVVCEFCFVPKPNEEFVCKEWLLFDPPAGILLPEEKMEIKLSINVGMTSGHDLNSGRDTLDDILILHLKNGRDHFICIQGDWLQTCYANSIDRLIKLKYPIRAPGKNQMILEPEKRPFVPKELYTLCKFLYDNGLDQTRIFSSNGSEEEMHEIHENLDTGRSFDTYKGSFVSIAEAIVSLLKNFEEPAIPYRYYDAVLETADEGMEKCLEVIQSIEEPAHYNIFVYVISFLREVLKHSNQNDTTEDELAIVFGEALIRKRGATISPLEQSLTTKFIRNFLDANIEPNFGPFQQLK